MLYQRRETSVLFSLNEFKKDKTKDSMGGGLGADTKTRDSGLIDIRAVARKESKARQARQTAGDLFADFGSDSSDSEAPVEMSTRLDTAPSAPLLQKKSSRAPIWISLAALLVVAGAVGTYLYLNRDQGTAAPAAQAQVEPPAQPAALPTPPEVPKEAVVAPKQPEEVVKAAVPEQAAAADAGAHEEAAQGDAGSTSGAGGEVAEQGGTGEEHSVEPAETPKPELTPAEKVAAAKAAKEAAAKKAADAKKRAEEKAMAMKDAPKVPDQPKKIEEKKSPPVAQNTQANSATDLLNMVQTQQKKETAPVPDGGQQGSSDGLPAKLSASVVRKVIREHQGKVVGCYRTHGGGGAGAVTINTSITVGGDGSVKSARVTTGEYSGNAVGSCVVSALRGMSFPRFGADSQSISIPFRVQ